MRSLAIDIFHNRHSRPTLTAILMILHVCIVALGGLLIGDNLASHVTRDAGIFFVLYCTWLLISARLAGLGTQSLYFLFLTCTIIFIFGRFFLSVFRDGYDAFAMDWFYYNAPSPEARGAAAAFVLATTAALHLGALLANAFNPRIASGKVHPNKLRTESIVFLSLGIAALVPFLTQRIGLYLQFGYSGLFMTQSEYSLDLSRSYETFLMLSLGAAVLSRNKKLLSTVLFVCLAAATIRLGLGQRTAFFGWSLSLIWILGFVFQRKINVLLLLLLGVGAVILAQTVLLNRAGIEITPEALLGDTTISFLHQQGSTLALLTILPEIEKWPTGGTLALMLPLVGFFGSRLFGFDSCEFTNFGCHLASHLNESWFLEGKAIGWSIFGDAFVLSNGNIVIASVIILILGFCLQMWIKLAAISPTLMILLVAVSPKIFVLARYGAETIFVALWYLAAFHFGYTLLHAFLSKTIRSHSRYTERPPLTDPR